ncbi:hypothetical protein [Hahella sp. NBU794]|uniref:hypothetical protein n=1 Tax=Hahella sp. NBU794 TaxID=3422590 RepID=UPI003D6E7466
MLRIEFEEPSKSKCDCCGNIATRLTRFVYKENDAFAVYFALFTLGHEEEGVYALIGLGEWGEGGEQENRTAFAVRMKTVNDNRGVMVVDRGESPWRDVEYFGRILDREEALAHPWIKDVFYITDRIFEEDRAISDFLG